MLEIKNGMTAAEFQSKLNNCIDKTDNPITIPNLNINELTVQDLDTNKTKCPIDFGYKKLSYYTEISLTNQTFPINGTFNFDSNKFNIIDMITFKNNNIYKINHLLIHNNDYHFKLDSDNAIVVSFDNGNITTPIVNDYWKVKYPFSRFIGKPFIYFDYTGLEHIIDPDKDTVLFIY